MEAIGRVLKGLVILAAFFAAFVINPLYVAGCGSEADAAAAIEAEMLEDLDALNGQGTWALQQDGERYEVLLALTQRVGEDQVAVHRTGRPLLSVAHACGRTTFYQSASACFDVYELAVEGTLTILDSEGATLVDDLAVEGVLSNLNRLELMLGDGGQLVLQGDAGADYGLTRFVADDLGGSGLSFDFQH